jgi:hypothetical protein
MISPSMTAMGQWQPITTFPHMSAVPLNSRRDFVSPPECATNGLATYPVTFAVLVLFLGTDAEAKPRLPADDGAPPRSVKFRTPAECRR